MNVQDYIRLALALREAARLQHWGTYYQLRAKLRGQ